MPEDTELEAGDSERTGIDVRAVGGAFGGNVEVGEDSAGGCQDATSAGLRTGTPARRRPWGSGIAR